MRSSNGRMQQTSASLFSCSLHANEFQVRQKMQPPLEDIVVVDAPSTIPLILPAGPVLTSSVLRGVVGARGDHVPGLQRAGLGQDLDLAEAVEDQLVGVGLLAQLSVDVGPDAERVRVAELVGGDDPGTKRAMRVPGLTQVVVDMALVIAHRAVIEDGVAHHDQWHLGARNPPATSPYDSRELQLVVELLRLARQPHIAVWCVDAGHQAEIQRRVLRRLPPGLRTAVGRRLREA